MRFEIDTDNKTVILKSQFTFAEINKLKKLLGDEYSEYKLTSDYQWTYYPWTVPAIGSGTFTLEPTFTTCEQTTAADTLFLGTTFTVSSDVITQTLH